MLCDRGILDGSAFINSEMWSQICDEQEIEPQALADKRYDAVLHMVTAAEGAEDFYNFGNAARFSKLKPCR